MSPFVLNIVISFSTLVIWTGLLFVSLCYKFYCSKEKFPVNKYLQYTSLSSQIFVIIGNSISIFQHVSDNKDDLILELIAWISLAIALVSYYLYHITALYIVYKESAFAISKKCLYTHLAIAILMLITPPFLEIDPDNFILFYVIMIPLMFLLFGGLMHIMYKFNHNLFLIVLQDKQRLIELPATSPATPASTASTASLGDDIEKKAMAVASSQCNDSLLDTITKQSLLSSIQISVILFIMIYTLVIFIGGWYSLTFRGINVWITQTIPLIISPTCLYLGFTMNNNIYQYICGKCHNKCKNKCNTIAAVKAAKLERIKSHSSI